jgi:hypothetical protein
MAKPFIAVHKSNGIEYATVCTPKRVNGKKVNDPIYLGRVINLKEGRFRSKKEGEFFYSLENGISYPTEAPKTTISGAIAKASLNLGHVYCTHALLERTGLLKLFKETEASSPDTLLALLTHRSLDGLADSHANAFFQQTYTSVLYPTANMTPLGISQYLAKLGDEAIRRDFLRRYISKTRPDAKSVGILIDSAGSPNNLDLPIEVFNERGGAAVNEMRLIYVVDRDTFHPIYYRAIPDNVVDIRTLNSVINELKSMNVNVGYSALDAGYNSENNLEELYRLDIDFMMRLNFNSQLYKKLLEANCDIIEQPRHRIVYNNRLLYMVKNKVTLPNNRIAFAYIGLDAAQKTDAIRALALSENPDSRLSDEEFGMKTKIMGMFIMISSLKRPISEVLPYYYSRQTIEQIFDTSKNYARLLSLGNLDLTTFNGHLLLSFMTTIVNLMFQKIFHKQNYNPVDFITELRGVTCGVYDDHLQVFEPTSKQKDILKILKMKIPLVLPLKP